MREINKNRIDAFLTFFSFVFLSLVLFGFVCFESWGHVDLSVKACTPEDAHCGPATGVNKTPTYYTTEALKAQKNDGCLSKGTCKLSFSLHTRSNGEVYGLWDCVGSGCTDDVPERDGGGGYSFSCGSLNTYRCQNILASFLPTDYSKWVYAKVLSSAFSNFGFDQLDTNLYDDYVPFWVDRNVEAKGAVGFSNGFFRFPEYTLTGNQSCISQLRNYAYIYVPQGWYSFANTVLTKTSDSCYYCQGDDVACPGNNTQTSWTGKAWAKVCDQSGERHSCFNRVYDVSCNCNSLLDYSSAVTRGGVAESDSNYTACFVKVTPPVNCRLDCRGELYSWMAASGNGSTSSPYTPNPVIPYDPNWTTTPDASIDLPYTYRWINVPADDPQFTKMNDGVYGPDLYRDFNGKWVRFGSSSQPEVMNVDLGSVKAVDWIQFNFYVDTRYSTVLPAKKIEVFCDNVLASTNDFSQEKIANNSQFSGYWTIPSLLKNCRNLQIKMYHRNSDTNQSEYYPLFVAEVDIHGWNKKIEEVGIVNPGSLEANFTRFNNWFSLSTLNMTSITGGQAASNPNIDLQWSTPKYFSGGWYPVETSLKYAKASFPYSGTFPVYFPDLSWRKCNSSDPSTCDPGHDYREGAYGAQISACQPGAVSCVFTPNPTTIYEGETKDITIGTIKDYSGSVNVVENPDSSDLTINSLLPVDSSGNLKINVSAGELTDMSPVQVALRVTADASDPTADDCDENVNITILPRKNWWQTQNMDVTTTGRIGSFLPSDIYFDLKGSDSPGVPIYALGTPSWGSGSVSETGWLANTPVSSVSGYNYNYFFSRVPAEVKNGWNDGQGVISGDKTAPTVDSLDVLDDGSIYSWVLIQGDLTIDNGSNSFAIGSDKLIIFVDGELSINSNITLGFSGFVMFVVSGNINIGPSVSSVSGIYLTNGRFYTGTEGSRSDSGLQVTGSVVALDGVKLQRSLNDNTNPAEKFIFSPSLLLQIPYNFFQRNFNWREVNP